MAKCQVCTRPAVQCVHDRAQVYTVCMPVRDYPMSTRRHASHRIGDHRIILIRDANRRAKLARYAKPQHGQQRSVQSLQDTPCHPLTVNGVEGRELDDAAEERERVQGGEELRVRQLALLPGVSNLEVRQHVRLEGGRQVPGGGLASGAAHA